jgi:hypothetical protein
VFQQANVSYRVSDSVDWRNTPTHFLVGQGGYLFAIAASIRVCNSNTHIISNSRDLRLSIKHDNKEAILLKGTKHSYGYSSN